MIAARTRPSDCRWRREIGSEGAGCRSRSGGRRRRTARLPPSTAWHRRPGHSSANGSQIVACGNRRVQHAASCQHRRAIGGEFRARQWPVHPRRPGCPVERVRTAVRRRREHRRRCLARAQAATRERPDPRVAPAKAEPGKRAIREATGVDVVPSATIQHGPLMEDGACRNDGRNSKVAGRAPPMSASPRR